MFVNVHLSNSRVKLLRSLNRPNILFVCIRVSFYILLFYNNITMYTLSIAHFEWIMLFNTRLPTWFLKIPSELHDTKLLGFKNCCENGTVGNSKIVLHDIIHYSCIYYTGRQFSRKKKKSIFEPAREYFIIGVPPFMWRGLVRAVRKTSIYPIFFKIIFLFQFFSPGIFLL